MNGLPQNLYTATQVRELDRIAIEEYGIPGLTLMTRAGERAFAVLRERWPTARRIVVCCGGGNNGGDGFVVAALARKAGFDVHVLMLAAIGKLQGDAGAARETMIQAGVVPQQDIGAVMPEQADVIVDALLGTGLDRAVSGAFRDAIEAINEAGVPVLAIDMPSGLDADCGVPPDDSVAVQADITVTFIGVKQGMLTGEGPDYCGAIIFDDLDVPAPVYDHITPAAERIDYKSLAASLLPARSRCAHKGDHGHVLVIGGDHGMSGAVRMAAEAAGRVGAGLVSVATRPEHAALISQACPEVMAHGVDSAAELRPLLARADVVAIGPGLGQTGWSQRLLSAVMDSGEWPLVVDADALNLLAAEPLTRRNWILTPHPGEATRLLASSTATVQQNRFEAAGLLQERFGGVTVLKGAGTLVGSAGRLSVCSDGNPGMASGGMGDVLTGVIAGLRAQGLSGVDAARLGVCLHAAAADGAARDGERGMLARHVIAELRWLANPDQRL